MPALLTHTYSHVLSGPGSQGLTVGLLFYILFNSISAISGKWDRESDNEKICAVWNPVYRLKDICIEGALNLGGQPY